MLPLLDVIFLVLAVFVVSSMNLVERRALDLELAASEESTVRHERAGLTVTLTEDGRVAVDGEPVPLDELGAAVSRKLADDPRTEVSIAGDRRSRFGSVVQILDRLRAAGVEAVAVEARDR